MIPKFKLVSKDDSFLFGIPITIALLLALNVLNITMMPLPFLIVKGLGLFFILMQYYLTYCLLYSRE